MKKARNHEREATFIGRNILSSLPFVK